jgi:hypothetical protein
VLPTEQVLGWCAQRGHHFAPPAGASRSPTPLEIRAVLEALEDCVVNYSAEADIWEVHLMEHNGPAGRSYSYLLGSPFTGDKSVPLPYISFDIGPQPWPTRVPQSALRTKEHGTPSTARSLSLSTPVAQVFPPTLPATAPPGGRLAFHRAP